MAVWAMPNQVPTLPDDPSLAARTVARAFYEQFDKPLLCAFDDNDPVTRGCDTIFKARVPGDRDQPHTTIEGG